MGETTFLAPSNIDFRLRGSQNYRSLVLITSQAIAGFDRLSPFYMMYVLSTSFQRALQAGLRGCQKSLE